MGGAAPTLEVELTAFEEIRAPKHLARVRVTARLQDQRVVRWIDTFTVDQPVGAGGDASSAAGAAMGKALHGGVAEVGDRGVATVDAPPAESASATAGTR